MAEAHPTLFEMPEPAAGPCLETWKDRIEVFQQLSKERGGLIPQAILPDVLDVSQSRVSELVVRGSLERVMFAGTAFVTGRSIKHHKLGEKNKGGRGHKRTAWQKCVIAWGVGAAMADVIAPEK